jgi:adenylate cyclase
VHQIRAGRLAWVALAVTAPTDSTDFPVLASFWPGTDVSTWGLRVGDRLLRVGDTDLRGVGPVGFLARVYEQAGDLGHVPVTYARGETRETGRILLSPVAYPWRTLPLSLTMVVTGALVLVRLPGLPLARSFFLAAVAYSMHWMFFFGGPRIFTYAWAATFVASTFLMFPLVLRTLLIFSDEVRIIGTEPPRRWPWLFSVFGPLTTSWVFGVPLPPAAGLRGIFAVNVAFGITFIVLLIRAFRNAGAVGRRRLKWVLYGVSVGTVPVLVTDAVAALAPALWWLHEIAVAAEAAVPICLVIAIVRYHLFDIDRLISATAVYSVLTVILGGGVLTVVPPLAETASAAFGIDAGASQLVLSFALAACLLPAQRRLRPVAERLFLPDRHRLEEDFQHLLRDLSGCGTPDAALTLAGERLDRLLVPETCRGYAATAEGYVLVYPPERRRWASVTGGAPVAGGDAGAAAEPPLAAAPARLDARRVPAEPVHIGRDAAIGPSALPPRTRALFESLGIAVVAHVTRGGRLAGLLCLGPKRSGDVYTQGDLALLAAVADKLSSEFQRIEQAESLRQERSMQEALRRYVPDPVASLLATGRDLDGGEREVSVLFVDLRSFTTYSETHAIDTVLAIVNRYTEAASGIIRRHRGTVLEFLGDGMMAVFGAPEREAHHARSAVRCALEIVAAVRGLRLGDPGSAPIEVSVGITTGVAFVGNVRASDRYIYTAIGDVPNLASRLEGLTRKLGASVAIDGATRSGAGEAAVAFHRHGPTLVRGRSQPVDVYFLPQTDATPAG